MGSDVLNAMHMDYYYGACLELDNPLSLCLVLYGKEQLVTVNKESHLRLSRHEGEEMK